MATVVGIMALHPLIPPHTGTEINSNTVLKYNFDGTLLDYYNVNAKNITYIPNNCVYKSNKSMFNKTSHRSPFSVQCLFLHGTFCGNTSENYHNVFM